MSWAHALGFSTQPTGLPKPAVKDERVSRPWRVPAVLELELEVCATDSEDAARLARTALEDVQARIDAYIGCWACGGELGTPEETQ